MDSQSPRSKATNSVFIVTAVLSNIEDVSVIAYDTVAEALTAKKALADIQLCKTVFVTRIDTETLETLRIV